MQVMKNQAMRLQQTTMANSSSQKLIIPMSKSYLARRVHVRNLDRQTFHPVQMAHANDKFSKPLMRLVEPRKGDHEEMIAPIGFLIPRQIQ